MWFMIAEAPTRFLESLPPGTLSPIAEAPPGIKICDDGDVGFAGFILTMAFLFTQLLVFFCCRGKFQERLVKGEGVSEATATVTDVVFQKATGGSAPGSDNPSGGRSASYHVSYEFDTDRSDGSVVRIAVTDRNMGNIYTVEGQEIVVKYLQDMPEFSMWDQEEEFVSGNACCPGCICFSLIFLVIAICFYEIMQLFVGEGESAQGITIGCMGTPDEGTGPIILAMLLLWFCAVASANACCQKRGIMLCCIPCCRRIGEVGREQDEGSDYSEVDSS